jgi:hypothetical protein
MSPGSLRVPPWLIFLFLLVTVYELVLFGSANWIDPDTPEYFHSTKPLSAGDSRQYQLARPCLANRLSILFKSHAHIYLLLLLELNSGVLR